MRVWADRMPSPARQQCGDTKACLQMQTACLDSMLFWRKYRDILCRKKQLLTLENRSPAWCLVSRASQSPCSLCSSRHAIINFHKCHCTIDSIWCEHDSHSIGMLPYGNNNSDHWRTRFHLDRGVYSIIYSSVQNFDSRHAISQSSRGLGSWFWLTFSSELTVWGDTRRFRIIYNQN